MVGVYTPGWQALPAASWGFVELVTHEGPVGTGEWSIDVDERARAALAQLDEQPGKNLLDVDLEEPLFMAWWDLVGQVLGEPLHRLWAGLFDVGFDPPERVPLAAYSWQRFPDVDGNDAVTFASWPDFVAQQVADGYRTLKISMTAYEPEDHVTVLERIRERVPDDVQIRIDAHGSWNFAEARRLLPRLEQLRIEYFEQPFNALQPQRFYAPGQAPADPGRSYQHEYYYRKLEQLRRHTTIPFSDHWWTPPIVHPPGASTMANAWEPDWQLIECYDPVDVANPDIGLGVFGLWRLLQLARFMGLHVTLHSNFELGMQSSFRAAALAALGYYEEGAGIYLGVTPRLCHPLDTEYNQVRDDVLDGGKLPIDEGYLSLSPLPGHGRRLDRERLERYRYDEAAVRPHRTYALALLNDYFLDRPRRWTMSGWPKEPGPERVDRLAYPYDVAKILGLDVRQDVDVELNVY
jgi:L-alanine-DL-glutamate epimerase-like enolase superfamily enzyme